ncbi:MAG TPA: hypothetical protein VFZ89_07285, partial [Solirubrobacteraceae bacterium]
TDLADRHRWSQVVRPLVQALQRDDRRKQRRRALRPAHALRRGGYLAARRTLDLVGLRDYPRL